VLSARRGNIYHLTILLATIEALKPSWNLFLLGGGRYRSRRHSCFVVDEHSVKQTPHPADIAIP